MRKKTKKLGSIFLLSSFIPFGFLCYSLMNQEALHISMLHPRVLIEASFWIVLLILGIFFLKKKY
jgi:hypothetical protein